MAQWKQLIFHRNITKPFSLQTNVTNAVIKLFACLHLVLVLVLCCLFATSTSSFVYEKTGNHNKT